MQGQSCFSKVFDVWEDVWPVTHVKLSKKEIILTALSVYQTTLKPAGSNLLNYLKGIFYKLQPLQPLNWTREKSCIWKCKNTIWHSYEKWMLILVTKNVGYQIWYSHVLEEEKLQLTSKIIQKENKNY